MSQVTQILLVAPQINYPFTTSKGSYSTAGIKDGNIRILSSIKNNYGDYLLKFGELFQIPAALIAAFIATESSGVNVGANKYQATGLMQITPGAFFETLTRRLKTEDIGDQQILLIKRYAPFLNFSSTQMKSNLSSVENSLIAAFKQPEFNIYAGCLYLDFLLDRFAINGIAEINKALVGYNAGPYLKILSANIGIALDSGNLSKNILVPKESRAYLVKILGIDGFLDLILKQQLVTF